MPPHPSYARQKHKVQCPLEGPSPPPPQLRSTALKSRLGRPHSPLPGTRCWRQSNSQQTSNQAGAVMPRTVWEQSKQPPFLCGSLCMCSVLTLRGSGSQLPERLQTWDGGAALRHPCHSHRQPDPVPRNRRHWPYKTRAGPFSISVSFYSRFPHLPATPAECESAGCFLRWVFFILCQLARWRESNNDVWAVLGWLALMDLQEGGWRVKLGLARLQTPLDLILGASDSTQRFVSVYSLT